MVNTGGDARVGTRRFRRLASALCLFLVLFVQSLDGVKFVVFVVEFAQVVVAAVLRALLAMRLLLDVTRSVCDIDHRRLVVGLVVVVVVVLLAAHLLARVSRLLPFLPFTLLTLLLFLRLRQL